MNVPMKLLMLCHDCKVKTALCERALDADFLSCVRQKNNGKEGT